MGDPGLVRTESEVTCSTSFKEECSSNVQPFVSAIINETSNQLLERIADDYGLSLEKMQERYMIERDLVGMPSRPRSVPSTPRTPKTPSFQKKKSKMAPQQKPKTFTYATLDKVLEDTDSLLQDMQDLDLASDNLLDKDEREVSGVGTKVASNLKKILLKTDKKLVEMTKHIKYLANTLHSVFPPQVVEALKSDLNDIANLHPTVSVLMCDIVGFTAWCADAPPIQVIECLSAYFQVIDDLAEQIGVYKVETIGDGYQAICGHNNEEDHSERMATFALAIRDTIPQMQRIFNNDSFNVRVGINSGPIVTGVIRADRPRWQLFGDTVNYASRMESTGEPGKVQVSRSTYDLLNLGAKFELERRGLIRVKGKGEQETFWLNGRKSEEENSMSKSPKGSQLSYQPLHIEHQGDGEKTVLIVDDMLSIVLQLSRALKKAGLSVVTARNGKDALDILMERSFHIVLSDIHMPVMGGLEFVKRYRAWERDNRPGTHQKIYALTGTVREDEPEETFGAAGFDARFMKTASKSEIISLVQSS